MYTMDSAHELHMCACARSPRHEHGACHMEMHMHWALRTAILSVGTVAYARVCTHRHSLLARTLHSIYTRVLCIKFSISACRRHTSVCAPSLQTGCTHK